MIKLAVLLFAGFVLGSPLWGTPDHSVKVRESFFGSNASSYSVLRIEEDNCSSYYRSETSTWLDEYPADDPSRSKARSTLLLKVSNHRDVDNYEAPPTVSVEEEDKVLTFAVMLKRYPVRSLESWTKEQTSKMSRPIAKNHFRLSEGRAQTERTSLVSLRTPWSDWSSLLVSASPSLVR
jgi:hypothetical protein